MIPDFVVAPSQVFNGFICWNFQAKVVKEFKIFFNTIWAVFKETCAAFKATVFKCIQNFISTFWTLFSMNNSFYNFKHNQVNLTLGPKNA